MSFKVGDRIRWKKPWWMFWHKPWILSVVQDTIENKELWLKDPYGAWVCKLSEIDQEEYELL